MSSLLKKEKSYCQAAQYKKSQKGGLNLKIKDRVFLGLVSGVIGNIVKMGVDEASLRLKISQRSFRSTAAGVWVSNKSEAKSTYGQLLGMLFDFGLGSLGGVGITYMFSKTGRDYMIPKGIVSGITIGSAITAMLSVFPSNKVQPKDAASNLSYMAAHAIYGVVTSVAAAYLGHPSIFDVKPTNNYLPPTEPTTEEQKHKKAAVKKLRVVSSKQKQKEVRIK